jgi:hypothetical protein
MVFLTQAPRMIKVMIAGFGERHRSSLPPFNKVVFRLLWHPRDQITLWTRTIKSISNDLKDLVPDVMFS